jgi:hypothetical protein
MAKYVKTAWNITGLGTENSPSFLVRACWCCPLEASDLSDLMLELYRILNNKSENPRTHLGFGDHCYFHAWAVGRAKSATGLFLRAQQVRGCEPRGVRGAGRGGARPPGTLTPRGSPTRAGARVWIIQSSWDSASGLSQAWVDWLSLFPPPSVFTPTPTPCPRWLGPLW